MSAVGRRADAVARAYLAACRLDVQAPKPGNVSVGSAGHGMDADDFLRSAEASAEQLARPGASLGERILLAVAATRRVRDCNTNLGIVLLCAPLAQAALDYPDTPLPAAVRRVLREAGIEDTEQVYAAIRLAAPGGLGASERHDVRGPARVPLVRAMAEAAARDRIARQYGTGYRDVLGLAAPRLAAARRAGMGELDAVTELFLFLLSRFPDSHIQRKFGEATALRVLARARAVRPLPGAPKTTCAASLQHFDRLLKRARINPGTTADLTVAALFLERLRNAAARNPGDDRRHTGRGLRLHLGGASLISTFITAGDTSPWL
ncbi:MAG: triphosphoribosyl-dephospho-CoA synthase [Thiohalocapsa sp.]|nr:triphosphoribosyl-dephospho-CoA synthase [Thiohalocapsa sp.]MCF7992068.1 triphosphoribosyl-dephospho-CoA synthase [Thiohalocapsa sp.]